MKNKSSKITTLLISCIATLLAFILIIGYLSLIPASGFKKNHILYIPEKSSVTTIAAILKDKSLIHSSHYFKLYSKLTKTDTKLRAGYFLIPKSINQKTLIHLLTTKNGIHNLKKVTIPEGYGIKKIAQKLQTLNICSKTEFENYAHKEAKEKFQNTFPFLKQIKVQTIEGYLFPDTYFFRKNESIPDIIKTMLKEFDSQIFTLYESLKEKKDSKYSFHELVTLASIIEKESRIISEMPTISSVFHNRLNKNMRLETDPTVVYAMQKTHKDKVYLKDLWVKSPYNTYRNKGFPPSPIASPGTAAFKAAYAPKSTPYLFFVAKPDGHHHFSKTFKEHKIMKYRVKRLKKQKIN